MRKYCWTSAMMVGLALTGLGCAEAPQTPLPRTPQLPKELTLDLGEGERMSFVLIPAGRFAMGIPDIEIRWYDNREPLHEVTISRPFYLGVCEVTQGQWKAVLGTEPWKGKAYVRQGREYAASYITWSQADAFCKALSQKTGRVVRLPTEAEWEYACRAGSTTRLHYGEDKNETGKLEGYAWYYSNAWDKGERYPHPVGRLKPNSWGLYDMYGNVWEWCWDWYSGPYKGAAQKDPRGAPRGDERMLRGGSFGSASDRIGSPQRLYGHPEFQYTYVGLRVAVEGTEAQ